MGHGLVDIEKFGIITLGGGEGLERTQYEGERERERERANEAFRGEWWKLVSSQGCLRIRIGQYH